MSVRYESANIAPAERCASRTSRESSTRLPPAGASLLAASEPRQPLEEPERSERADRVRRDAERTPLDTSAEPDSPDDGQDAEHRAHEHELTALDPDVEREEREGDVALREPDVRERARETEAVQEPEGERDDPGPSAP